MNILQLNPFIMSLVGLFALVSTIGSFFAFIEVRRDLQNLKNQSQILHISSKFLVNTVQNMPTIEVSLKVNAPIHPNQILKSQIALTLNE